MRLPDRRTIILMPRLVPYPVLARKVRYWMERRWRGWWDRWRVELPSPGPLPAVSPIQIAH
ncbi:hypothetical protein NLM16_27820 [Bradyrhizobium brasilense]|uniref:hypothetical protein n=1 Tax=Bradyrhizobium brasilense TaxID=1419277 RepID=UPI002877995E|nr:hypothetical protein [Bradyrhizobium brasilense]MCP3417922.1 hypothetical protein [Bradyrhizobium brasilense]